LPTADTRHSPEEDGRRVRRVLSELRVRDLGVIHDVTVELGPGMTALTGETGTGKTLLVEALSLLLGARADASVVRAGAAEAIVEGSFGDPAGADVEPTILARAVARTGRSRAWIDGRTASVGALEEAASGLVELHGQHLHRALVRPDAQRRALDHYGGIDLGPLRAARERLGGLLQESERLGGDPQQRAREVDMLRFQIDEIASAAIEDPDEERRLEEEEERLAEAGEHRLAAAGALTALTAEGEGAIDRLAAASAALGGRAPLAELSTRVRGMMAEASDLAGELRHVVETWEDDPARLEEVRARRHLFRQLERKYGPSLAEVAVFADDARARLGAIEADRARAEAIDGEIAAARADLAREEEAVAAMRRRAAPRLADQVSTTLQQLAMPSARVEVRVEGDGPGDTVTILLGANPGEPTQALAKAASGGELARTMLAVRLALTDAPPVLVFDEVDAGVGGRAATAVGAALAELARSAQVLVVTHLAQVAAQADRQFEVVKTERGGRTTTAVRALDTEGRVVELSRMLSGRPQSESARRHARELLEHASSVGSS
jgi:DNA repair protein RecN (Recombination protein N)